MAKWNRSVGQLVALVSAAGAEYLRAFDAKQLFTGLGSAVFSCVWLKSRYIPPAVAAWGIVSSRVLALVTLVVMVFPALGAALGLTYMLPMGLHEVGLGFQLIVKGIRRSKE